jgi:hypothetical protein
MTYETITYSDYNGVTKTKRFYFNINKAELIKLETMTPGGVAQSLQDAVDAKDAVKLMKFFEMIISMAYGEKSEDGMRFMKRAIDGHRLSDDFEQTDAYSELFTELATNAESATAFVNGILPAQLQEQVAEAQKNGNAYPPQIGQK